MYNKNLDKMNKELLRMQMLAGVITESQYKEKVEELAAENLELKSLAKQLYQGFKKLGAQVKLQTLKTDVGAKGAWEGGNVLISMTSANDDQIALDINSAGIGLDQAKKFGEDIKKSFPKAVFTPVNGKQDWQSNPIVSFLISPGKEMSEGAFDDPNAVKLAEPQKGGSLQLKNAAMKVYSYIKKNGFTPYLMVDGKNVGDRMNHDFAIQVQGAGGHGASASLAADGLLTISGNRNKTNPQVMEKLQNDIIHDFPFLTKHSQSNPSGLIIKLAVDPKANVSEELDEKDSLNEHYVAGGIVGIGAVNQIPSRAKADYEDAFEYFLSQKYPLNEEESVEEAMIDPKIENDPNFQKLANYFEEHPDQAKDVKKELSSLSEAVKRNGKYYVEDAYGNEKEVGFKEYLKSKLLAIGLPAAALGFVGALMAGPLGAMDPGSILQAIGVAAGLGGAAGAALDYGK